MDFKVLFWRKHANVYIVSSNSTCRRVRGGLVLKMSKACLRWRPVNGIPDTLKNSKAFIFGSFGQFVGDLIRDYEILFCLKTHLSRMSPTLSLLVSQAGWKMKITLRAVKQKCSLISKSSLALHHSMKQPSRPTWSGKTFLILMRWVQGGAASGPPQMEKPRPKEFRWISTCK